MKTQPRLYSEDEVDYYSMKLLRIWKGVSRSIVSLDFSVHQRLFPYLEPVQVIRDRETKKPLIVILNREKAMQAVKNQRNFK